MNARLEISVPGKDRRRDQIVIVDRFLDLGMKRPGIADAGGAAVADKVEPELIEISLQSRLLEIIGTTREPGASEVLTAGLTRSPRSTAFFASKPAASITLGLLVLVQLVIAAIRTLPWPIRAWPW